MLFKVSTGGDDVGARQSQTVRRAVGPVAESWFGRCQLDGRLR